MNNSMISVDWDNLLNGLNAQQQLEICVLVEKYRKENKDKEMYLYAENEEAAFDAWASVNHGPNTRLYDAFLAGINWKSKRGKN